MASKENFKAFITKNPSFASYVNSGKMSWQKFYEMYDLYGEENSVWEQYQNPILKEERKTSLNEIIKNVDIDSIKEHISSAQKALDLVQELTSTISPSPKINNITPRPLNKFFED